MFNTIPVKHDTPEEYRQKIEALKTALEKADALLVGAGAGLSTSAGFTYSGERFEKNFADFHAKYGFSDMYTGGFYPYTTPEEHWAYWSRNIMINRYADAPKPVYENVRKLVDRKNYFVLTTNVDHCFQKAGFDKARLFYTQGDYGLFQCSEPCHQATYDNEAQVRAMYERQKDMRIPSELIPYCPRCGKPMSMNLRSDSTFVEDAGWHTAAQRYADFLTTYKDGRILFLELGVGANTPGIIKYPFQQMTANNPQAIYACINYGEAYCFDEIRERAICIDGDIGEVIAEFLRKIPQVAQSPNL
ncbi:Sir2 silent information regulator family NAD-dependent deacetylase [Treponema vincentii]|jgi:SIR2 family protein|uniref:SIR2 family NAD-dependent protein deacylase n=1 Tax=Treponema vincentii TaxID=69710 RepID=UPI0020A2B66A|nr:Sir2 family NAD-dependent protein deacetylase [Treponema vincentii]UTC46714.1 Sir2 silent information regulator family NAD-dependent deacetylase [Treponema vincentii]